MELQFLLSLSILFLAVVNAKPTQDEALDLPESKLQDYPKNLDWREKGAVTKVRDQGLECEKSDWAFATIGAVEAQLFKATSCLTELSEQELLDCSKHEYLNYGCGGGSIKTALRYIAENGISTEQSYQYSGLDSNICLKTSRIIPKGSVIKTKEFSQIWPVRMVQAINEKGPIVAMVDVKDSFLTHKDGIYDETNCNAVGNHNVLIVGYGETEELGKYWIAKNSWGEEWGEAGFFRIARGSNVCGIEANFTIIDEFQLPNKLKCDSMKLTHE